MKDRIDELLDGAIASYTETPRPGLEQRVMYGIRSKRRRRWRLLVPALALAALVCLALIFPRQHSVTQTPSVAPAQVAQTSVRLPPPPPIRVKRADGRPKQPAFPMSTPLTEGERALLALSQQHQDTAITMSANLKKTNSDLPEIEPLEIPPLRSEAGQ
jgi:hypothetical protein